jgi:hypothetical protein
MTLKLVYPALAQIAWTFVVLVIMFMRRRRALVAREVRIGDVAVSTERYPEPARLAAANFSNQFETPVLFFALIMLAMETGATGFVMAALAWGFVATRIAHTLVHTGGNRVQTRAMIFGLGLLCLAGLFLGVLVTVL